MQMTPGQLLGEGIRLTAPLGEGAMGSVWAAHDETRGREVAVKFVRRKGDGDDELARQRFLREASASSRIASPHVVEVHGQGFAPDGTPYIVMERLEGESLGQRLARERVVPAEVAVMIASQLGAALAAAHHAGVVHRDIKPDNVFLTRRRDDLHVKVFDFGIAKQTMLPGMGTLTHDGVMVGTPEFMSPEQVLSSKAVDHRADLWAFGVTLYVMLTGVLPFEGEALGQLCVQLLEGRFEPATRRRAGLPDAVDAFFQRAFAKDPAARHESAIVMFEAFARCFPEVDVSSIVSGAHPSLPDASGAMAPLRGLHASSLAGSARDAMAPRWLSRSALGLVGVALLGVVGALVWVLRTPAPSQPAAATTASTKPTEPSPPEGATARTPVSAAPATASAAATAAPSAALSAAPSTTTPQPQLAPAPQRWRPPVRRRRRRRNPGF